MAGAEFIAVISLGASIIQVVDGCNKILNRIQAFRKNMAFQDIELQLPLLMKDIENLNSPEYRELIDEATEKALTRVLEGCRRQISALDQLIQYLTPEITASKLQRTWKGFKSFSKDTKLREILSILSEYKATITLHLSSRQMHMSRKGVPDQEPSKSYFEVLSQRVSHFVGRKLVLDKIKNTIALSDVHPAVVVLTAVGGQGKTQIALEFCHKSASSFNAIFWIDASSRESAMRSFENIARKLAPSTHSFLDPDSRLSFVKESLRDWSLPWLLVFDNYDHPPTFDDIKSFFPTSNRRNKNAILITSRHTLSERLGVVIRLGGMTEEESLELLRSRCAVDETDENDAEEGKKIVGKLGYLPLAIDQAAAYISIRQLPFRLFLDHFEKRKDVILNHTPTSLWEYRTKGVGAGASELNLSVLTTWELSFDQIGREENERRRIGNFLTQSAFFNPSCINEGLFRGFSISCHRYGNSPPGWLDMFMTRDAWDPFQFQDTVVGLMSLSLIQSVDITSSGTKFSLHPLIKDWLQLRNSISERCHCTSIAISMTAYFIQDQDVETITLETRQESLATIDACVRNYSEFIESPSDKRKFGGLVEGLQTTFATFLGRHDRHADAEALFLESLEWQMRELGELNLSTLRTANNLAAMYLDQRQLEKAEALLVQTVASKEALLGPHNPITLNTVNNLGNLYAMQSSFDQAKQMYTRTLDRYSAIYGERHRTVLEAQNNLGEVAMKMGHLQEAETRFNIALAPLRGSEETALMLYIKSNIAVIYKLQGRHLDAITLYEEVIRGREALLGPTHSSTLISMCELGDVYVECGQREKAGEWYSRGKADNDVSRRNKRILEAKTSDETSAPGVAVASSHDSIRHLTTPETALSYDRIKWDGPEKSLSEVVRSGRALQNRMAQQAYRKRIGWASVNDGILTPEQKQLQMTKSTAREASAYPRTRESFSGPATELSEASGSLSKELTLASESAGTTVDFAQDKDNSLPPRFFRLCINNLMNDDIPAQRKQHRERPQHSEPEPEPTDDTPDRRGRALQNKMLALSRMSQIFPDVQRQTPEQSHVLQLEALSDQSVPVELQSPSSDMNAPQNPFDRDGFKALNSLNRHGLFAPNPYTAHQPLNVRNWPVPSTNDSETVYKSLGTPHSSPISASDYENNAFGNAREVGPVMTHMNSPITPEQAREFVSTSSNEALPSKDPMQIKDINTLQRPPSPLARIEPVIRDAKPSVHDLIYTVDRSGITFLNPGALDFGSDRFHKMSSWNDIPCIFKRPNWDSVAMDPFDTSLPPPKPLATEGSNPSNINTETKTGLSTGADHEGGKRLNQTALVAPPPAKIPDRGNIDPYALDVPQASDTSTFRQGPRSETRRGPGNRTRTDDAIPWEYSR